MDSVSFEEQNRSVDMMGSLSQPGEVSDRSNLQSTSQFPMQAAESRPRHIEVVEELTSDFEKGLLKLK